MDEAELIAYKAMCEAVQNWLNAAGWDGLCTGWVLVGHTMKIDTEGTGDDLSSYPIVTYPNPENMPDHVGVGLLTTGLDAYRGVGRWSIMPHTGDDDE